MNGEKMTETKVFGTDEYTAEDVSRLLSALGENEWLIVGNIDGDRFRFARLKDSTFIVKSGGLSAYFSSVKVFSSMLKLYTDEEDAVGYVVIGKITDICIQDVE